MFGGPKKDPNWILNNNCEFDCNIINNCICLRYILYLYRINKINIVLIEVFWNLVNGKCPSVHKHYTWPLLYINCVYWKKYLTDLYENSCIPYDLWVKKDFTTRDSLIQGKAKSTLKYLEKPFLLHLSSKQLYYLPVNLHLVLKYLPLNLILKV